MPLPRFDPDRRSLLAAASAALITAPLQVSGKSADDRRICSAGRIPFGAAVQARHILIDRGFRDLVIQECCSITPELEFKWSFIEHLHNEVNQRPARQLIDFARAHGLLLHGHALLWHESVPGWAIEDMLDKRDWTIIRDFFALIAAEAGNYAASWDVINEPVLPGQRDDNLRPSPLLSAFGPDYIRRAFDDARALFPGAALYINEYGLVYNTPEAAAKRQAILRLLETLKNQGIPN